MTESTADDCSRPPYLVRLLPDEAIPSQVAPTGSRLVYYYEWVPVTASNEDTAAPIASTIETIRSTDPPELVIDGEQQPITGEVDRTEEDRLRVSYLRLGEPKPPGTYEFTFRFTVEEPCYLRRGDGVEQEWTGQYEYSGSVSVRRPETARALPTKEKKITTTKQFVSPNWM